MNPGNEAKTENLEQDSKVTEQLPEQVFEQRAGELKVPAHDGEPVENERARESNTKTGEISSESAQPVSSGQPVPPEGALASEPAAAITQDSFQPANYAKETGEKRGKIAAFFRKTWVKAVTLVGAAIILFMGGMGSGMVISNHGGEGHRHPGHAGQMEPGGQRGGDMGPGGKIGPGVNGPGQMQPGRNQQPGQMTPGDGNQIPPQGQNQQQGNQNPKQQDKQGEINSQNSNGDTSDSQKQSATPSDNS